MKSIHLLGVLLSAFTLQAQTLNPVTITSPPPLVNYVASQLDGNSQVWKKVVQTRDPQGETVSQTNQAYVELATGLNHLVNGQWVASKEEIDISPDGSSAAATNGQHQVYFPGDIYSGVIKLVTPDGQILQSQPVGLSYFDGTNSVLLAVATNSTGAILPSSNQVIFPNAFAGLNADLLYTYTKAGFEQDVILREQPPDPASLGLASASTRLQVLTEFITSPQPSVTATMVPTDAGNLEDDSLGFGTMQMGQGKAFLMGTDSPATPVDKRWLVLQGRQFLVEEVPIVSIATAIDTLPPFVATSGIGTGPVVSKNLIPPPRRLVHALPESIFVAQAVPPRRGLVLDYVTMTSQTNWTFQSDTTYYIAGNVNLSGTNSFEGGAVLKYTTNSEVLLVSGSGINWQAGVYRPVILTAMDDNSVGAAIGGSTGKPTNYYATSALVFNNNSVKISNIRIAYAKQAIGFNGGTSASIYNAQFVNCDVGINLTGLQMLLRNALFCNTQTNDFNLNPGGSVDAQNVTFSSNGCLAVGPTFSAGASLSLTNCIVANVAVLTNGVLTLSGDFNGFYLSPVFGGDKSTNNNYPFQSVGAGNYYLTNGCAFLNAGTTNIDPPLLTELQQKTTYPPLLLTNQTPVTVNTNLSLQAQRDTEFPGPDLGYHYDPIDYIANLFTITNATLIVTNGAAIACYNYVGIYLQDGSSITSIGTPLAPDWFVRYSSVQEQPVALGSYGPSGTYALMAYHYGSVGPSGVFRFTKFACPAGGGDHFYDASSGFSFNNLLVRDCEMWSGTSVLNGDTNTVVTLENNLFAGSIVSIASSLTNYSLAISNNLFWNTSITLEPSSDSNNCSIFNNDFDTCAITVGAHGTSQATINGYDAYLNCNRQLYPTNANDIVSSNSLAYQAGPSGTFYQPTGSPLINIGSTNANLVGLYHYTVVTNANNVEGTNIVSIGYHYVGVDQYGNPLDSNGDGIPDYLEDANGNGIYDTGDLGDWQGLNLNVIITRPRNGSILP